MPVIVSLVHPNLRPMSYAKFLDDLNDEMGRLIGEEGSGGAKRSSADHQSLMKRAHERVFNSWLNQERFSELIAYLHSNFDTGGGDEWIVPLSDVLVKRRLVRELKRLWRGVIATRTKRFWRFKFPPKYVKDLETRGFKMEQVSSEEIASLKQHALDAMLALHQALNQLEDFVDAAKLEAEINLLKNEKRPQRLKTTDKRKIDDNVFWEIIEHCRAESNSNAEFVLHVTTQLGRFSATEIRKFQKHLLQKLEELRSWDLWALAYILRRGCSDDAFDYFCAWVVTQGRNAFELAKSDISRFASDLSIDEDPQLEEFMYVADEVYELKTGAPMKPINISRAQIRGESWKETELERRYSEICARFGYVTSGEIP